MSNVSNNLSLSSDTDAEVELISLTFEKLPRYRLKADCNIQFSGYQHSDFKLAEQVQKEITELSNEQIEKTLEYFLLCGLRVCKMTETYEDCAALRMLVEEQKAHMDEAANIGLNLLQRNLQLEQRLNTVEDQLEASKDTINQLKHQLHLKDDLLRLLHNEIEEAEDKGFTAHADTASAASSVSISESHFPLDRISLKNLESKLSKLEEENMALRNQQVSLNANTDILESKEQQLIDDCVRQLLDSTKTVERLSSELNKKTNDYLNQHEEISRLLTTNIDLDNKVHQLLTENDNLIMQLRDQQTKQFTLTKELTELRDRYDECINLLNERQDQIRQLKKQCKREAMKYIQGYRSGSPDFAPTLAMEFEDSNRKEMALADQSRAMRVMEQARNINNAMVDTDETSSGFTDDFSCSIINTELDAPSSGESGGGNYLLRKSIHEDCEKRRMFRKNPTGFDSSMIESQITDDGSSTMTASFCTLEAYRHRQNRYQTIQSFNTNILNSDSTYSPSHNYFRIPDKLQLVKPIEGSQTLRNWQNLATPSITKALFEEQSHSVCFRGQQPALLSPSPPSSHSDGSQSSDAQPSIHSSMVSSDYDDADYDDPLAVVQSKCPSTLSGTSTCTYTSSRMPFPANQNSHHSSSDHFSTPHCQNPSTSSTSAFSLNLAPPRLENGKSQSYSDRQDDTPVNETSSATIISDECASSPMSGGTGTQSRTMPSWLDRLTVKSMMTNILGYQLPILDRIAAMPSSTTSSSSQHHPSPIMTATIVTAPASSTSLIGRLTNLPPLAQRRYPQAGLNLLTSTSSSHSIGTSGGGTVSQDRVVHRADYDVSIHDDGGNTTEDETPDELSPGGSCHSNGSQLD